MSKHGENIYKRRDGRYEGRYVIGKTPKGGTRFGYVYGRQYAQVRKALLEKKAELLKQAEATSPSGQETLASWMQYWMESELLGSVKASSWQTYQYLLTHHLLPALGDIPLSRLTAKTVRDFVAQLDDSGLATSTIRGIYRLLTSAMRFALDEGIIRKNPCRRIRLQRREVSEQRVLSGDEQAKLLQAAIESGELPTLLSLYTGMRLGEVCALKWSDINWSQGTIAVQRTVQRIARQSGTQTGAKTMFMIGTPKSVRSCRILPAPDFILVLLRERLYMHTDTEYVFGTATRAAEPRTVQRRFMRLAGRLGIGGAHFHTLRHTFATRLLELGVDVKTVCTLLGHSSARTTLDYYAHSLTEQQRSAIALLADGIEPSQAVRND